MVYGFSVSFGTDSFPQPTTTTTREDFYRGPVVHTGGTAHITGHIQDALHMSAESEINCPLCSTDMKAWSAVRQKLHLNACCEQAINECPFCPGCNKSFNSKPSRSHLKLCASRLNISILNLMAISERKQRPRFYHSEFTHFVPSTLLAKNDLADDDLRTAVALSLSTEEACKWRRSEAKLANKLHPADFGPPTHLLLTDDQRKAILSDRLSEILLQHSKTGTPSVSDLSWRSSGSESILWHLAGCPIEREANWENLYYVSTLVPPISPTKMAWGENLLSLSQIPGRSIPELCSNHRGNHPDVPERVHSSAEVKCSHLRSKSTVMWSPHIRFILESHYAT
ncbi:unnamed protein product [Dicrocoelium dendriticum]|nr:unnamed protein product [Dicrocoelium dendriticum]